jgi:very-short-patch-repair endonuclease
MWTDDDYRKRRAIRHSPSKLERWLFAVLDGDGIRYKKFATVGRYVPDALLPDHMVIIEVDGVAWHRRRVDYDKQRDRDLAAAGYTVLHFTDLELISAKTTTTLIGKALADVRTGTAVYRPPLLWRH